MSKRKKWIVPLLVGVWVGMGMVYLSATNLVDTTKIARVANAFTNKDVSVQNQTLSLNIDSEVIKAVEKVADAVVGVINIRQSDQWSEQNEAGSGSGVIYKKVDGYAYIVTNNHVIDGADQVEVRLADGNRVAAEVLGSDQLTDLAVLKIKGDEVKNIAEFGSSDDLRLGEPAIAIGNPLGAELSGSVTLGIVSGLERSIPVDLNQDGATDWHAEVIQTDAAINPGNSGGALINIQGKIIGINSMKIAKQEIEGIGFAIPSSSAKPIIAELETYGIVKRPFIGIGSQALTDIPINHWQETLKLPTDVQEGVAIVNVMNQSPADLAGLEKFDVIVEFDGESISNVLDLRKYLYQKKKIGDVLTVTFYRNGEKQEVQLALTEAKNK